MKKLEKLKLHKLEEICVEDQKTMLGGSGTHLHWDQETGWTNMLDEVTVTGNYANQMDEVKCYGPPSNSTFPLNSETFPLAVQVAGMEVVAAIQSYNFYRTPEQWMSILTSTGKFAVSELAMILGIPEPTFLDYEWNREVWGSN